MGHVCTLPTDPGVEFFHCRTCGWDWRRNAIVGKWFRYIHGLVRNG